MPGYACGVSRFFCVLDAAYRPRRTPEEQVMALLPNSLLPARWIYPAEEGWTCLMMYLHAAFQLTGY